MILTKWGILGLMLVFIFGCTMYHPRPLNINDLTNALSTPDKNDLRRQATFLNHPRIPPVQLDFTKPLTAKELSVLAVLMSPDLNALREKECVAEAQVFDAGLLPDPEFAPFVGFPLLNQQFAVNFWTLAFNWDIGALATRVSKLRVARAQADQTRYDIAWQEWLVANQAELLATQIYFLQEQLNIAKRATQSSQQVLQLTQANLLKHNTTIDNFGLRQATYLDFLDQKITLERTLKKTILQLKQLLGLPPSDKLSLGIGSKSLPIELDANCLFEQAMLNRLDLIALQAGYISQEAKLYQAVLGQFPHFMIGFNRAKDDTGIQSIGLNLTLDIPLFNRNRGAIAIAKATREQLYKEYIARLNQTRGDIAILVTDLNIIRKEEKILQQQLPEMRKTEQLMRKGLETGNITLIAYQTVLTSLLTNELRLLSLKQAIAEKLIGLQMAIGRYYF